MDKEKLNKIKLLYKVGTRIVLDYMDDIQAPPIGTKGTIVGIDDIGSILIRWDNGSSLKILLDFDSFHIICNE